MGGFLQGLNQGLTQQQQMQMQREQLQIDKQLAALRMKQFDMDMRRQERDLANQTALAALFEGKPAVPSSTATIPGVERFADPRGDAPFADFVVNLPRGADPSARGAMTYPVPGKPAEPSPVERMLPNMPPDAAALLKAAPQQAVPALFARMFPQPKDPVSVAPGSTLVDPTTGKPVFEAPPKPATPVSVGPGHVLVDPTTGKQVFDVPAKPEAPKSPLTVSDENRIARELFGVDYLNLDQKQQARVNARLKQDRVDISAAQGTAKTQEALRKDKETLLSPTEAEQLGVPFGTTKQEAVGLKPMTGVQRESKAAFQTARNIIADIKKYSEKVNTFEGGLWNRAVEGGKNVAGALTQTNEDAALLQSKGGELARLARSMGEKGAMAEGDIQRAASLVPGLTDSKNVAIAKLKDLEDLINASEQAFDESLKAMPAKPTEAPKEAAPKKSSVVPPKNEMAMETDRARLKREGVHPDIIEGYLKRKYGTQ